MRYLIERIVVALVGLSALGLGVTLSAAEPSAAGEWGPITVVQRTVAPGTSLRFPFSEERSFKASYLNAPVFVSRGAAPGPSLCLTAGIHGDELNGVEVARKAFSLADPAQLKGTLIALPAINMEGVRTGSRYLTDRRDLNRAFPGRSGGSIASLIAYAVTSNILPHCEYIVDLHTGSDQRANVPQIRADLDNDKVRELAVHFGHGIIIGGAGPEGSWRREAVDAGIPAIIYEAGGPLQFEMAEIEEGVKGVRSVMAYLGMIDAPRQVISDDQIYTKSTWVRASFEQNGFFFPDAQLGDTVKEGDLLGRVVDPVTDFEHEIRATRDGRLIGRAISRPVLNGYGLFHIAWVE